MKHDINIFHPNKGMIGRMYELDRGHYNQPWIWMYVLGIVGGGVGEILLNMASADAGYESGYDPLLWHWNIWLVIAPILFTLFWTVLLPQLTKAHMVTKLNGKQAKLFKRFESLPEEQQGALGGRKQFYEELISYNNTDIERVYDVMGQLEDAAERAEVARYDRTKAKVTIETMREHIHSLNTDAEISEQFMKELTE